MVASTTSTTCSAPTRRCSPPARATTPRSPCARSHTEPRRCWWAPPRDAGVRYLAGVSDVSNLPAVMPAAVLHGKGQIAVEDVAVPALGQDQVLVEVSHCGVCGSDLHMVLDG